MLARQPLLVNSIVDPCSVISLLLHPLGTIASCTSPIVDQQAFPQQSSNENLGFINGARDVSVTHVSDSLDIRLIGHCGEDVLIGHAAVVWRLLAGSGARICV